MGLPYKDEKDFIEKNIGTARQVQAKYGVPASVVLAQAAHESGWGNSTLSTLFNNLFGVKGSGDAGSTYLPTQEEVNGKMVTVMDSFAQYSSQDASFDAYGKLIQTNYKGAVGKSADAAVDAIAAGGYATDSNYASAVKGIIKDYNLTQYDDPTKITITVPNNGKPGTVITDTFGNPGEDPQKAYDRAGQVSGAIDVTGASAGFVDWIKSPFKAIASSSIKAAIILVLVVLLVVIIISALPVKPTPAGIVKGAVGE